MSLWVHNSEVEKIYSETSLKADAIASEKTAITFPSEMKLVQHFLFECTAVHRTANEELTLSAKTVRKYNCEQKANSHV